MHFWIERDECTRQAHANRSALAAETTTCHSHDDVDLFSLVDRGQSINDGTTVLIVDKVLFDGLAVDHDLAATGSHTHASDARLATTGSQCITVDLIFFYYDHGIA